MPIQSDDGKEAPLIAGSLKYTKKTLAILFFWLIWGDICFMLMEGVVPSILPLEFEKLHASNFVIALIMSTLPSLIGSVVNPIVSFRSDRYRSNWGRRIPFIVYTMPFLVMALIGLGFTDKIAVWVSAMIGHQSFSVNSIAIITIGVFMVAFAYFNSFVGAVFWYLFNDVVPEHLLARFMSLFRLFSMLTASVYNFFIFKYAGHHSSEILIGCALVYFFGFGLMCLKVKEGTYPPPPEYTDKKTGVVSAVKTYFRECLSIPHYWFIFAISMFGAFSGGIGTFTLFFYQSTGLNLAQIGDVNGVSNIAIAVFIPISGWLGDKYHPLRVVMIGTAAYILIQTPLTAIFLFWHPQSHVAFLTWLFIIGAVAAPVSALTGMMDPPAFMRLFPRSRYGQYCSANAMLRSLAGMAGGVMAGLFLDKMGHYMNPKDVYRLTPVWQFACNVPVLISLVLLYFSWKRYGGDHHYLPPVPGESPEEYAETEILGDEEVAVQSQ